MVRKFRSWIRSFTAYLYKKNYSSLPASFFELSVFLKNRAGSIFGAKYLKASKRYAQFVQLGVFYPRSRLTGIWLSLHTLNNTQYGPLDGIFKDLGVYSYERADVISRHDRIVNSTLRAGTHRSLKFVMLKFRGTFRQFGPVALPTRLMSVLDKFVAGSLTPFLAKKSTSQDSVYRRTQLSLFTTRLWSKTDLRDVKKYLAKDVSFYIAGVDKQEKPALFRRIPNIRTGYVPIYPTVVNTLSTAFLRKGLGMLRHGRLLHVSDLRRNAVDFFRGFRSGFVAQNRGDYYQKLFSDLSVANHA